MARPLHAVPRSLALARGIGTSLAAALAAGACGGEGTGERPPSILFISVDTLAARHMSLYGYARDTTPRLDAFAREAVVFDHCWANAPFTTPSYISLFAGQYAGCFWSDPASHAPGVDLEETDVWYLPQDRRTLAEVLREAGYRTAAFVDNWKAGPHFGLDQGFELYDTSAAAISVNEPDGGARHFLPLAKEWLAGLVPDEPFFLFLQPIDVHAPYTPPRASRGASPGTGGPTRGTSRRWATRTSSSFSASR